VKNNSIADCKTNNSHNTNINNFFNIYLPKANTDNKNFSLEIMINKPKNNNKNNSDNSYNNNNTYYFNNKSKKQKKLKSKLFFSNNRKNKDKNKFQNFDDPIANEEEFKKALNAENLNNNVVNNNDINHKEYKMI